MESVLRLGAALGALTDRMVAAVAALPSFVARRPWWQQVLLVWLLGRLFSLVTVLSVARMQGPSPWSPARPGYLAYIDGWDAGWYHKIYDEGYPAVLPTDADGRLVPNQWAFYPLLPYLVKGLNAVTGVGYLYLAPLVSTLASLALCLLMYRLFATRAAGGVALFAVALFSFQPSAPILQFGYAESLGLLMLVGVLLLVIRGRYLTAVPIVVVMSVTRPQCAPLALGLLLVAVGWLFYRRREPRPPRDWLAMGVLVFVTGLATFVWPVVMAVATDDPYAYFATEAAWHGDRHVLPGQLWANIGIRLFGRPWGIVAPVVLVLVVVVLLATRTARRMGAVMYLFTASYLLYLLGVVAPNGALPRLMMPAFPLFLALSMASSSRAYRVVLVLLCLTGQVVWTAWLWHWSGTGLHGALEANP